MMACQKQVFSIHSSFPFRTKDISSSHTKMAFRGFSLRSSLPMHQHGRNILARLSSITSAISQDLTVAHTHEEKEIKLKISVSGERTQEIFDEVFSKLVNDAQPIPGFRRVKGGKTPDITKIFSIFTRLENPELLLKIPKHILMHILGSSKVNSNVICEIISSAVAECVEKEGLKVIKDLRVDESFEELEAQFEPGKPLDFSASLTLQ